MAFCCIIAVISCKRRIASGSKTIAGGDSYYQTRLEEFAGLYSYAREEGLNTTGHLYETKDGCYPQLLPYLQRIGHSARYVRRL